MSNKYKYMNKKQKKVKEDETTKLVKNTLKTMNTSLDDKQIELLVQIFKFIIVGGIATLIDWIIYYICYHFIGIEPLLANIISFSMMVFSKRRQGFPDFMLGLTEVDTNKQKIYFSKYEIAVEHSLDHKEAIPFKLIEKE